MNSSNITIKSPLFITTLVLFVIVLTATFAVPKENWKKIFNINSFATAFSTNTSGDWNSPTTWGNTGTNIILNQPRDIAISPNTGNLYITSCGNSYLIIADSNNVPIAQITNLGLNGPMGAEVDPTSDRVYIVNQSGGYITIANPDGTLYSTFASSTLYDGLALDHPSDIAIHNGYIYITDTNNNRIVVMDLEGNASTTIAASEPFGITISPTTGEIYLVSPHNYARILNPDGTASSSEFLPPSSYGFWGLKIPSNGQLYVGLVQSPGNSAVGLYNLDFTLIEQYNFIDSIDYMADVNVATSGDIYASDMFHNRVVVFNPDGTPKTAINNSSKIPAVPIEGSTYPGINDEVDIGTGTVTLTHDQSADRVVIFNGASLDLAGYTLNVSSWWNFAIISGSLIENGGTINFISTSSTDINSNANISVGTVTLTKDESINNLTILFGGTLDLNGYTLNVYGNWSKIGGTFIANGGTVNFVGVSQTISGDNTFENLTKQSSSTSSLLSPAGDTTTITGTLALNGSIDNLLSIGLASGSSIDYSYLYFIDGSVNDFFWTIAGMDIDSSENIYSIEQGGRVKTMDKYMNLLSEFSYNNHCGPSDIVRDTSGNIYFSDQCSRVLKFDQNGTLLQTIGSTSPAPGNGNGEFNNPRGMDFDSGGNLYVVDQGNNRIQRFDSSGNYVSQFGSSGSGEGQFSGPNDIKIDSLGNIYVSDTGNNRIQKFDSSGNFLPSIGSYGSGLGQFDSPTGIYLDSSGYLYVADTNNHRIQIFNSEGAVFATISGDVDGTNQLTSPTHVSVNSSGDVFVTGSSNNKMYKFIPSRYSFYSSIGSYINGTLGGFISPYNIFVDEEDNFYEVESGGRVIKFDNDFNVLSYFDQNITFGGMGGFCGPFNITGDFQGHLFISDHCNRILKTDLSGNLLQTIGTAGSGDGQLNYPRGVAIDPTGNIYVVDQNNYRVQKFDSSGNYLSQFGTAGDGNGQFNQPNGIALDSFGNIYVADSANHRIQKFDSSGNYVSQIGGPPSSEKDGLIYPTTVRIDSNNNIIVAEPSSYRFRIYNSYFNLIYAFGYAGTGNGEFSSPYGLDIDSSGNIFVADGGSQNKIQKISLASNLPYTNILYTGSETPSFSYLNISGSHNLSSEPFYCLVGCVDGGGNTNWIFPSRRSSRRVITETQEPSVLTTFRIIPENSSINLDTTKQFTAEILDQYGNSINTKVYWSTSDSSVGRIDDSGVFHAQGEGTTTITGLIFGNISTTTTIIVTKSSTPDTIIIVEEDKDIDTKLPGSRIKEGFCFTSNLFPAPADNNPLDVLKLQTFLNENNFTVSTSGPGSYENETYFYGTKTTNAVKRLQEANFDKILAPIGLTTGTGNFGNLTREYVNNLLDNNCITIFETKATTTEKVATTTEEISTTTVEQIIPEIITPDTNTTIPEVTQTKPDTKPEVTKPTAEKPSFDINDIFDQQLILGAIDTIKESYGQVSFLVQEAILKIKNIFNDSTISITAKVVTTTALVFGVAASISTVAFATPISFSEVWLIPTRMFGLLAGALGIRRKQRQWGTVYDSVTKRPLDPVYVSLVSTETNKEVAGAITDIDGRYGFLVLPGKYKIVATKTNYIQPSKKMAGKSFDEVYNDLYFGEELIVSEGEMITKNIPMDSLSFDWNEFAKTKMDVNKFTKQKDITWAKISKFVFIIGALISVIAVIVTPEPYNYIIVGFYFLAYILNYVVLKSKKSGTLIEKNTKIPLSFAIVKIFREGEDTPLTKKIADKFGDYYALVPKGKYSIKVEKKKDDGTYTEVFKTEAIDIKSGVINMNFVV
ncbi:MAG: 6-bladed beta-propeller [Candidatus Paceibacterota bacterium]|jgi:DNA-binding beta-propeller fold protein YncE